LVLAIAARQNGIDLYSYQAASGARLAKAVAFLVAVLRWHEDARRVGGIPKPI